MNMSVIPAFLSKYTVYRIDGRSDGVCRLSDECTSWSLEAKRSSGVGSRFISLLLTNRLIVCSYHLLLSILPSSSVSVNTDTKN